MRNWIVGLLLVMSSAAWAVPVKTDLGGLPVSCSSEAKDIQKFENSMNLQDAKEMIFEKKEKDIFLKTFNAIAPPTHTEADAVKFWEKGEFVVLGFMVGKKFCLAGEYDKDNFDKILAKAFGDKL